MPEKIRFKTGQTVMTMGVADRVADDPRFAQFCLQSMARHANGDWGDLCDSDKEENDKALISGGRLFSAYKFADTQIWIITEADRSATTILFPEEY